MWIQMWVTSSTHQKWNWDWHWVPKTWWRVAQKREKECFKEEEQWKLQTLRARPHLPLGECYAVGKVNLITKSQYFLRILRRTWWGGYFDQTHFTDEKTGQLSLQVVNMLIRFTSNTGRTETHIWPHNLYWGSANFGPWPVFVRSLS